MRDAGTRITAIAHNTLREAIRNRVLYSLLLFAFVTGAVTMLFGSVSIGDPIKYVVDFGLMSVSLFGVIIATVLGVNLLNNELGRKTIFNVLAKPVSRWEFIVGKFLGLVATLAATTAAMAGLLLAIVAAMTGTMNWGIPLAALATLLELAIIVAVALFFSSIVVTPTLGGLLTAAVFIVGRSAEHLTTFFAGRYPPVLRGLANVLYAITPHLDRFYLGNDIAYGTWPDGGELLMLAAYAVGYCGVVLALSSAIFSRREFT